MKFVSYNIRYSQGRDGRFDLERTAATVRSADVIALQEVVRNLDAPPDKDQPARLGELLSQHHWVYGPNVDLDASTGTLNGSTEHRRLQFGNMVLSRWPILSCRNLLLPRVRVIDAHGEQSGRARSNHRCSVWASSVLLSPSQFRQPPATENRDRVSAAISV